MRGEILLLTKPVLGMLADSWHSTTGAALASLDSAALQMRRELLTRSFAADQVDRCTARQL